MNLKKRMFICTFYVEPEDVSMVEDAGTVAVAKLMRQAVGASSKDVPLNKYAKAHREPEIVLQTWGQHG